MNTQAKIVAQVHRLRDRVAVFVGDGQTTYLTPDQAAQLSDALRDCIADIDARAFRDSTFSTVEIKP